MTLGEYLQGLASKRREPGAHDCGTLACDWAVLCGHPDPMAEWRGAYETEAQLAGIIEIEGGVLAMFERGCAAAGIERREGDPLPGDIGVLRIAGHEAGSVFTGERWAFVGNRGVGLARVEADNIAAVWAVAHG